MIFLQIIYILTLLGYVFRTPESEKEDWTLGLSWNSKLGDVQAFLHGVRGEEKDMLVCITFARPSTLAIIFPLTLSFDQPRMVMGK